MVTDSDNEAHKGNGYAIRHNTACPPSRMAPESDPDMEEIDVTTWMPVVPPSTTGAGTTEPTMPVPAGTVIQQGLQQAATTDRGQQDMDTAEPTAESGGVEGGNGTSNDGDPWLTLYPSQVSSGPKPSLGLEVTRVERYIVNHRSPVVPGSRIG